MSQNANLFQSVIAGGDFQFDPKIQQALANLDANAQIQNAGGIVADQVKASVVTCVGELVDDSGSIKFAGNSQAVRDGHNLVIDAFNGSSDVNKASILMMCQYLNGEVLFPFSLLSDAVRMDTHNYNPNKGTPLYDQSLVFLTAAMAKVQEFEDNGVTARGCWLITTDGADEHSIHATATMVKNLVDQLYRTENHIVAGMGIADGRTDFRKVFQSMGIREEWILTPGNTPQEIRAAFQLFSQSAVRASQTAGGFSNLGGFGS